MWTASARAKINLHLAVHGRRPDGYHALTTVFQTIGLADTLTIVEHDGPFTLRCPGSDAPEDGSNLVVRAAHALASELGRPEPAGLRVTLDKQVPTQAGLGGGSADAMAALRLLCEVWAVPAERDLLIRVGGRLGSDVPFFAWGGTALGLGRGDDISPLPPLPPLACAIVRPRFGVSTADAYRWVAESRVGAPPPETAETPFEAPLHSDAWRACLSTCRNDFEPVVAARHPDIAAAVAALRQAGAVLAMMSGSGSAIYGLFEREAEAASALTLLVAETGWSGWLTATTAAAGA
ncbi:MAG: 4-(cytidine 5'-diphospho)-2-C-methyl-D-erythritol kinase [Vicinamibacteraceae bacterium]